MTMTTTLNRSRSPSRSIVRRPGGPARSSSRRAPPGIDTRPIRSETRATLVRSIASGRRWLNEIVTGNATGPEAIAARERCTPRHVTKLMSLAFLAPDLVQAAIDGRLPRGVGVSRLTDAPDRVVAAMGRARALTR